MNEAKRARLEAAGFKVGTVAEFLQLSPAENALVEARLAVSSAIRERRLAQGLSQSVLERRIHSSQSRVAKIEAADRTVSMDLMARAFFETGASVKEFGDVIATAEATNKVAAKA